MRDLVPTEDADPSQWLGALEGPPRLRPGLPEGGARRLRRLVDADAALARIGFLARCAALEDLAYGGAHADAAQRSLRRLFR
jgi:hypothetical protein